jgi:hypothetical protein
MKAMSPNRTLRRLCLALAIILSIFIGGQGLAAQSKTVHVTTYVKKNGTVVKAHDRKAPAPKGTTTPSGSTSSQKSSSTAAAAKSTNTAGAKPLSFTGTHPSTYCETCARDSKGRIVRGEAAKTAFMKQTGFPHGRPGYVIDHIVALACGGADNTSNMQWQTVDAAKAKDKVERKGCK